jgi:BirA family biotin operon repressor/biotin-[acetyl-CoA-carboxylase] ligase
MISKIGEASAKWANVAGLKHWYEPTTTSTNLIAKDNAFSEELLKTPIFIYFTDYQSQGKGRGTNRWLNSSDNSNLLSSWSFYIQNAPSPLLSCFIGLAVFRALSSTWPFLPWSLKAPNDIYLADKKVAGLLIETISKGNPTSDSNGNSHRLIIGLGFNIFAHPTDIENASHLNAFLGTNQLSQNEWYAFLDRLLMEFSLTISNSITQSTDNSASKFTANEKSALLHALNRSPLLTEPYLNLDDQGNIFTPSRKISWYEI